MTISTPGVTLGVVGGGQLGRMLAEAAAPLGVDLVVTDPTEDPPAGPVASDALVGDFDEFSTIRAVAERADYLTFEIELTDPDALEQVAEETGVPVHPKPDTLRLIQDKLVQKRRLGDAGVPVPAFRQVDDEDDLLAAGEELGYPLMLKAREGGYDGRGNYPVESPDDVTDALDAIQGPAMAEEMIDFERELAVMGCLGADERDTFPVTETIHREEILRETVSPPRADEDVRERARSIALDVLDAMEGRGVYGIELFETSDGEILLNEIAPRPHNSGHWTIEGCHTSQFEQHVRAVTGRPLGTTERRGPTVSANVLGDVPDRQRATLSGEDAVFETPRAHLHWYGKREVYRLRKMGHVTLVGDGETMDELLADVRALRERLTFQSRSQ
ncbi:MULTISPECIES: 5-(carboxyamino)imidazole ribonucleotide synthase [Halomicrobium]|uniref:N5-carboxyaminoimidazole ribonucleotide synthase n=2 Tax=Halomicrobium mukohataei TaxID=57705 RepID=C7P4K5_HALMD|nr:MULTISPECIES: 5-(carboxyamino)imidazole ribonucleotide synthase [Halomicrobium]ACV48027.1 phosphoribosylaminoimidazole carboxylase, ATPase subunit [Halomicrobium mukohataei DSM 12286]QCD66460.1 5-(carboxyamino)imidazole ribonucleotide synthase [Halomicrobium mukohataei]QFR21266.1 5-(carboxyamino)imidazole ribonucleotide synthase [Halomicrobium sp. ZPS1]